MSEDAGLQAADVVAQGLGRDHGLHLFGVGEHGRVVGHLGHHKLARFLVGVGVEDLVGQRRVHLGAHDEVDEGVGRTVQKEYLSMCQNDPIFGT